MEAAHAVVPVHAGIHGPVEGAVGRLDAQEVAVGAGLPVGLIHLARLLAHGERHCHVECLDPADEIAHPIHRQDVRLAGLKYHGAIAEGTSGFGAGENLLRLQAVARQAVVVAPQAAIEAVALAAVRELDQPAQMDGIADIARAHAVGRSVERVITRIRLQQGNDLVAGEGVRHLRLGEAGGQIGCAASLCVHALRFLPPLV